MFKVVFGSDARKISNPTLDVNINNGTDGLKEEKKISKNKHNLQSNGVVLLE